MPACVFVCMCIYILRTYKHTHTHTHTKLESGPVISLSSTVIALKKKPKAPNGVIVANTVWTEARILRRRIVKKVRMCLEKMSFVLEEEK
jgi:hypothetical protein